MRVREALIKYFEEGKIAPPKVVATPPARIDDSVADGFVHPSFATGSIFVKSASGEVIRLAWEPMMEGKPPAEGKTARWRGLEPGTYSVIGYRMIRKDDSGTEWVLSGIAPKGMRTLTVMAGRVQKITISPVVTFGAKGNARSGFMIQVPIHGAQHAGVTIYKAGKRIPMGYTITGAGGKELESGAMTYG